MLKIEVKVTAISNLAEARYCAGMGVQYIGYNIDATTNNAMPATTVKEIQGWIAGTQTVLEIGKEGTAVASEWENAEELIFEIPQSRVSEFNAVQKLFVRIDNWDESALALIPEQHCLITPAVDESNAKSMIESVLKHKAHFVFLSWRGKIETLSSLLDDYPIVGIELKGAESQAGIFEAHDLADIIELLESEE